MSPPAPIRLPYRIVATLLAAGLLAACGFKGPLYLPPPEEGAAPVASEPPPTQSTIQR